MVSHSLKADRLTAVLAEAALCTVTHRAQAASIAGDLLERRHNGLCGFGRDLAGTCCALALHSVTAHPLSSAVRLATAAALWSLCYLAARLLFAVSGWLSLTPAAADCLAGGGLRSAALAGTLVIAGFVTGTILGCCRQRGPGCACLPLAVVFVAVGVALASHDLLSDAAVSWHCLLTYLGVVPLCYAAPLMLGAALPATWTGLRARRRNT